MSYIYVSAFTENGVEEAVDFLNDLGFDKDSVANVMRMKSSYVIQIDAANTRFDILRHYSTDRRVFNFYRDKKEIIYKMLKQNPDLYIPNDTPISLSDRQENVLQKALLYYRKYGSNGEVEFIQSILTNCKYSYGDIEQLNELFKDYQKHKDNPPIPKEEPEDNSFGKAVSNSIEDSEYWDDVSTHILDDNLPDSFQEIIRKADGYRKKNTPPKDYAAQKKAIMEALEQTKREMEAEREARRNRTASKNNFLDYQKRNPFSNEFNIGTSEISEKLKSDMADDMLKARRMFSDTGANRLFDDRKTDVTVTKKEEPTIEEDTVVDTDDTIWDKLRKVFS